MEGWVYPDNEVEAHTDSNGETILKLRSETGDGVITILDLMPGVAVLYNDFHMQKFLSQYSPVSGMLCLDHCREGRIEQMPRSGVYCYTGAGDLKIDTRMNHNSDFYFPLSHYHGMTIGFNLEIAENSIHEIMPGFPFTLVNLKQKFCKGDECFFLRKEPAVEHIFSEMYHVPQSICKPYLQIKVLELLLWLGALDFSSQDDSRPYFYKEQVEKVKAAQQLIAADLKRHFTIEELSRRFDIPSTTLKNNFKAMYGSSLYAYLRTLRMNRAAAMLKTSDKSIAEIANEVGYENPSKFSAAFVSEMHMQPLEYRKTENPRPQWKDKDEETNAYA